MYYAASLRFADINGDGKADLCGRFSDGIRCATALPSGLGFGPATVWVGAFRDDQGWANEIYTSTIQLRDITGDGKAGFPGS